MLWEFADQYDPKKVEATVLSYWMQKKIRSMVLKKAWEREGELFAFLEGPPTTNGYMHAGHARGRIYKDVMVRYNIVKGRKVWAQAGWDTQGLPVEIEIERFFGVKSKRDIEEKVGVEKFIEECKKSVDHYISEWVRDNERLAVWLDYENAYETRHPRYLETVWTFIKKAHEKGLLYKAYRVVPRCPRCGTALSNHEVSLGTEVVKDPSLYFKVKDAEEDLYYAVWTTTPWTIIANEALAVNPDIEYVIAEVNNEKIVVAKALLQTLCSKLGVKSPRIITTMKGKDLEGRRYIHPLSPEVPRHKDCCPPQCTVVVADYVNVEEGTGIVHTAPAHGPEDFETAMKYGLPVWTPLKSDGFFGEEAGVFSGLWFKDASKKVIEVLREKGLLLHLEEIEHEYPHCWRCGTPLMFYPTSQWFIKTTALVPRMRELLKRIKFRPKWGYNRMDSWVESSRDWCISRERYWGTPLPVWVCEKCGHTVVVGSLEELRKLSGTSIQDPHKPFIDNVLLKCPKCGGLMRREPFVVDVWADSGVAHTAALKQLGLEKLHGLLYPYSFALEPPEQVRGWFYTLLITSTLMHDKEPYKMLGMHGLVLDEKGQKMSKSKGNYVLGREAVERHGADQLRLFMTYRTSPWQDVRYVDKEIREIGGKLRILYNVVRFLISYATLDGWTAQNLEKDLGYMEDVDKWAITELWHALKTVEDSIEEFDLHAASRALFDYIVEKLSRTYVVAVRPRVWIEEDAPEKRSVYATLFLILKHALPYIAVFTPFIAEYLYQTLYRKLGVEPKETVMLELAMLPPRELVDENAWKRVNMILEVHELLTKLRGEKGVKRRMPISCVHVVITGDTKIPENKITEYEKLLSVLSNIKEVEITETRPEEYEEKLVTSDGKAEAYVVRLLDEETLLEGLAKEVIRRIQVIRKEMGLRYDEKIHVKIAVGEGKLKEALLKYKDYVANEVRAQTLEVNRELAEGREFEINGEKIRVSVERITENKS